MQRIFVVSLSLLLLLSSCPMKKVLWDHFEIASSVPATLNPLKTALTPCVTAGDALKDAEAVFPATVNTAAATQALVLAAAAIRAVPQSPAARYKTLSHSIQSVPVYLKLGRLIFYS